MKCDCPSRLQGGMNMGQEGIMEKTLPTIFRLSDLLEDMRSGCGPPTGLPLLCQCVWEKGKGKKGKRKKSKK